MVKYKFKESLIEGLIKARPNRFLMDVELEGKIIRCHCPTTGRIGNLVFENVPCLLLRVENSKRKTPYSVEAISLDSAGKKIKSWIGINQTKMNRYVEFFLNQNQFSKMVSGDEIQREKPLGNSRIDFLVKEQKANRETYLEVKMPLITLPIKQNNVLRTHSKFDSFDRLIKHFTDLANFLKKNNRAIVLLCYMYDAKAFQRPVRDDTNSKILKAAQNAQAKGLENWQANFRITPKYVELLNYFELNLF